MRKLLAELRGRRAEERKAYFYCAMVLLTSADDPVPLVATGSWHGRILDSPQGDGGFGYDPLFGIVIEPDPVRQCSAAELTAIDKQRLSHRGQALKELVRQLQLSAL